MEYHNYNPYRSPYEAYPFLCEDSENLCCDFELLTDEIASHTGLLRAQVEDEELREELLRVQCKNLVRLMYRHCQQGKEVPEMLFDLTNLLSAYFFHLALRLNALEGVEEIEFISRNYL